MFIFNRQLKKAPPTLFILDGIFFAKHSFYPITINSLFT